MGGGGIRQGVFRLGATRIGILMGHRIGILCHEGEPAELETCVERRSRATREKHTLICEDSSRGTPVGLGLSKLSPGRRPWA